MGWFGSKREDVVDLTMLQRKGLLKRSIDKEDSEGFVNLGVSSENSNKKPQEENVNALGFLGNLASIGGTGNSNSSGINPTPSTNVPPSSGGYLSNLKAARESKFAEFQHMKVKIDDIEYKIDRFIDKIDSIEERLRGLERRGNNY